MLGSTCQNTETVTSDQQSAVAKQDDGTKGGRCCSLLSTGRSLHPCQKVMGSEGYKSWF